MNKRFVFFLLLLIWANTVLGNSSPQELKKRLSVIINPISGGVSKEALVDEIITALDSKKFDIEVLYTKGPHHATILAKESLNKNSDIIVVVGGDGSINEVGQALIGSHATLGIIPTGSGNGLARHLNIPLKTADAVAVINQGKIKKIDTVRVNDRYYLGVAGIGFDAEVGWAFSEFGHRGFLSYLLVSLKEFPKYRPSNYNLIVDGASFNKKAFLICFANCSQFGNGAYIAPKAVIDDGYLDVVILKKFPIYASAQMTFQLFHHSLDHSEYVETIKCKEIRINNQNLKAHIDGEPVFYPNGMSLQIFPASLNVLAP